MTLKNLLNKISKIAIDQKCVNFSAAGNSLYALNGINIDCWPVLFVIPKGRHRVEENLTHYGLDICYLDRLLEDNSNEIDIMSFATEQLKNILLLIKSIDGVLSVSTEYDITPFEIPEGMNDRVCGEYATVKITVRNDVVCGEE